METEQKTLSLCDKDLQNKIRTRYVAGEELRQITDDLGIPRGTVDSYYYNNVHSFRDFVFEIKKERMIARAERVSDEILAIKATDNAKMLSIKQKEAEFLRETQGKDLGYSKRIETIGLNINKTEPLDEEQRAKLNKLLKKTAQNIVIDNDTEVVSHNEPVEP